MFVTSARKRLKPFPGHLSLSVLMSKKGANMTKFTWIPLAQIQKEPENSGLYELVRSCYWIVDDTDHIPVSAGGSLQYNISKDLAEAVAKNLFRKVDVHIVFLEKAWIPVSCADFDIKLKGVSR